MNENNPKQTKEQSTEQNHPYREERHDTARGDSERTTPEEEPREIENFSPDEEFDRKFDDETEPQQPHDPYGWADENPIWKKPPAQNTDPKPARTLPPLTPARRLAEGALMAALSTLLGILAFYAPILDMLLLIVYPIPIIFLIKRHNIGTGLLAFAVSSLLLMLILGVPNAAFVVLSMGALGIWYGIALRKSQPPMRTVAVGTVLAAASTAVTTLLSLEALGISLTGTSGYISQYVQDTVALLQESGVYSLLAGDLSVAEYSQMMTDMLTSLIPGMLVIVSMLEAFLCYIITGAIFRRLGLEARPLPKFRDWHMGWPALWGLIIALLAYLGHHFLGADWLRAVAINILYIYYPLMMITGISIVVWFQKTTHSLFLPLVLIIGVFIMPSAILICILMFGLVDTVVDFRSWSQRRAGGAPRR